jgi:hypothetical protein
MAPTTKSTIVGELYEWVIYFSPDLMSLALGVGYTAYRIRTYVRGVPVILPVAPPNIGMWNVANEIVTNAPYVNNNANDPGWLYYRQHYNHFNLNFIQHLNPIPILVGSISSHARHQFVYNEAVNFLPTFMDQAALATQNAINALANQADIQSNNFYRDVCIQGVFITLVIRVSFTIIPNIPSFFQQIFAESDNDSSPRRELRCEENNKSRGYLGGTGNIQGEISHYLRGTEKFNINDSTSKSSITFDSNKSNELEKTSASELNGNAEISLIALNQTIADNFTYTLGMIHFLEN